jgi:hypothetical protein
MSGQNYSVISWARSQKAPQNPRVPHSFAFFAKGGGFQRPPRTFQQGWRKVHETRVCGIPPLQRTQGWATRRLTPSK